jgi:D-alanyl-D-alanine carboxypeptidase/D-alanyl-D-alanine-endopeptidase (penicillin-binding protein 4)
LTTGENGQAARQPLYLLAVGPDANLVSVCNDALRSLPNLTFRHIADPQAAVRWAKENDVAAIVIDNDMPGMYGAAFVRQLHTLPDRPRPHVVVIERPANPVPPSARHAGIDDILEKPVPRGSFVRLLESALSVRRAERALWEQAAVLKDEVGTAAQAAAAPPDVAPLEPGSPPALESAPPESPEAVDPDRVADRARESNDGSESPQRRRRLVPFAALLALLLLAVAAFGWNRMHHDRVLASASPSPQAVASAIAAATPAPASTPSSGPTAAATTAPSPGPTPSAEGSPGAGVAGGTLGKPAGGSAPGGAGGGSQPANGMVAGAKSGGSGSNAGGAAGGGRQAGDAAAAGAPGAAAAVPAGSGAVHAQAGPTAAAGAAGAGGAGGPGGGGRPAAASGGGAAGGPAQAAHPPPPLPPDTARAAAAAAESLAAAPDAGYLILDAQGREVVAHDADVPRPPASTIKVLTAAVAIATLGPEARFTTRVVAQGPIHDGVVDGGLALVGGGDPVLRSADLNDAAATLYQLGVRHVRGDLAIDATAFTGPEYNPHWAAAERGHPYAAGTSAVSVDEGIGPDRRAVPDERAYAAGVFAAALQAQHIAVDGPTRFARAHGGTVVWTHESPPLSELIATMLVESDNHIAEQLLRDVGLVTSGVGSETAGIASLRAYLVRKHVPVNGLVLYDGSGLALDNRATPRTLATLLWRIQGTAEGDRIHAALPAVEGAPPAGSPGHIVAKTGHVNAARGLVGYVDRKDDALPFAFLDTVPQNDVYDARRSDEERALHALAGILP